jgi:hypothetical protein
MLLESCYEIILDRVSRGEIVRPEIRWRLIDFGAAKPQLSEEFRRTMYIVRVHGY